MSKQTFESWAQGYGVIQHKAATRELVQAYIATQPGREQEILQLLHAADRLSSAAMWLVIHMTYARHVHLDGTPLGADDFKQDPQGHTGGSLNMVPAYVGYLTANALSGISREWLMGQGHCVAAVDAINLLVGNALPVHAQRYSLDDAGLSQLMKDFYSYQVGADGKPVSPVGSHVNVNTAGASIEGGYLGFAGLHYVHQPVPGERLVAFLSDGAFEEQRGSDWAPRWWRAEDSGLVVPIMIANGRRIDQRTTTAQLGGSDWFVGHLKHHHFDPVVFDGTDPAAFALMILQLEDSLAAQGKAVQEGSASYPVRLPYGIAETVKGYGFAGAGTNAAHGTPLPGCPAEHNEARDLFNESAARLFVPQHEWRAAVACLNNHGSVRLREAELAAQRGPVKVQVPPCEIPGMGGAASPMAAMDNAFVSLIKANPALRVRVGNPDEMRSNRFDQTLDLLKHRVTSPEAGVAEALDGKVITALNEEAITQAVLANRSGLNLLLTYEAFAPKMQGALRQAIIFARHQKEAKRPATWAGIPLLLTSHLWENGKNEQSHQDSALCEAMLGEMSDMARVCFPADAVSAVQYLRECYRQHGQIFPMVVPKQKLPVCLTKNQADELAREGALRILGEGNEAIQLLAIGAYQYWEALRISERLVEKGLAHSLVYIGEPGKFRAGRDESEQQHCASYGVRLRIFGKPQYRLGFCHGRPEVFAGVLRPLDLGVNNSVWLGYINRGGTLDVGGLLFANRSTWAHGLNELAQMLGKPQSALLTGDEIMAVEGEGDPYCLIPKPYGG